MAKDKTNTAPAGNNVVALNTSCCVEKCTSKTDRMAFCKEHYLLFKEGLVNKQGQKPTDFDKKYQAWMMRKKAA